ncbi:hypothetical protein KQI84_08300 [bacterium]|nr:hypothetical protein [bacterium]
MSAYQQPRLPIADLSHIPRWWRWLFPELNELQYNAVYAAFEVRRKSIPLWKRTFRVLLLLSVVTLMTVAIPALIMSTRPGLLLALGGWIPWVVYIAAQAVQNRFIESMGMPASYRQVFFNGRVRQSAFLDLWQIPIARRDIAESVGCGFLLYWHALATVWFALAVLPALGIGYASQFNPVGVAWALTYVMLIAVAFPIALRLVANFFLKHFRRMVVAATFGAARERGAYFKKQLNEGLRTIFSVGVTIIVLYVLAVIGSYFLWRGIGLGTFLAEAMPESAGAVVGVLIPLLIGQGFVIALWSHHRRAQHKREFLFTYIGRWLDDALPVLARTLTNDVVTAEELETAILKSWEKMRDDYGRHERAYLREKAREQR